MHGAAVQTGKHHSALYPFLTQPTLVPRSQPPASAATPTLGRWTIRGVECRTARKRDGRIGCYLRLPHTHELFGRKSLDELSLALSCPNGITYAGGGAHGWFIGTVIQGTWEEAWDQMDELARQLLEFTPSEAEETPKPPRRRELPSHDRISGVHVRASHRADDSGELEALAG